MARARRFLLVTAALSTIAAAGACKKEAIEGTPGNPKGMSYDPDAGTWKPMTAPTPDPVDAAPPPPPPPSAETPQPPKNYPPPGNPKGSRYDAGKH